MSSRHSLQLETLPAHELAEVIQVDFARTEPDNPSAVLAPSAQLDLYNPHGGRIQQRKPEAFFGGCKYVGTYVTALAMHEVRVYRPNVSLPDDQVPKVLMTTPLGTGIEGHNDRVAQEIARTGCDVILKGVPRYYKPQAALSLTADVNEMLGLVDAVETTPELKMSHLETIDAYGESQAAMKELGVFALAEAYGRRSRNGLVVAACFLRPANVRNLRKFVGYHVSMVESTLRAARDIDPLDLWDLRKTFDLRDAHHHAAVIPILESGEAGRFLAYIRQDQQFTSQFYGKDRSSRAHRTKKQLDELFPTADNRLDEKYGHVDGIMSPETRQLRTDFFTSLVRQALEAA